MSIVVGEKSSPSANRSTRSKKNEGERLERRERVRRTGIGPGQVEMGLVIVGKGVGPSEVEFEDDGATLEDGVDRLIRTSLLLGRSIEGKEERN